MASVNDDLMTELTGLGYTEGSVSDRERARLLDDLLLSPTVAGLSLYDLYELAGEEPRIA